MENSKSFNAKAVIFKEGQVSDKLYIIKKGEVVCLKASKDRLIPVYIAREQDIIGESALLENFPYTYSTIALSTVELISIPASDFKDIMEQSPSWLTDLTTTMVNRFQNTSNIVAENRILHSSILSEESFPSSLEIEYKKLLG